MVALYEQHRPLSLCFGTDCREFSTHISLINYFLCWVFTLYSLPSSLKSRMFYLQCASLIITTLNTLYSPLERRRRLHNWEKTFGLNRPIFSVFPFRVLRDNPLECSCDIHWLQQWQLNDHSDLDKQPLHCLSNGHARRLDSLLMENCSELNW